MADLNDIEKKLDLVLQNQQELKTRINKIESIIGKIESDIYMEDDFDLEIVCPYCNNEFVEDVSDGKTEITCPECENVIELDWTGDPDECDCGCDHDGCAGCHGGCDDESDDM